MPTAELQYSAPSNNGVAAHNVDLFLTYGSAQNGDGSYTVTAATGTYTVLNNDGSVNHVDTVSLSPPGSFSFNNNHLFIDPAQPYVDVFGITYKISNSADTLDPAGRNGQVNFYLSRPTSYTEAGVVDVAFGNTSLNPNVTPAPCYVTGTHIRVLQGRTIRDVPVQRLRVGDLAITASGRPRPIRWIGTRSYPGLSAPKHDRTVRIRAGALADGVPVRDLLVSPDHCLWLDGLFVAAGHLVNGWTITRGEAVADLTYWHVELDGHDLLLAENTPAESFLAAPGVRAGFDGVVSDAAAKAPVAYAERVEHGLALDALRECLILRAGLSVDPAQFGAMRSWLDLAEVQSSGGLRVAGWAQDGAHPDGPVCLDIVIDGTVVAMTLADRYRADIEAVGIGHGCHGFDLDLDVPLAPSVAHTVEVRRSADGASIGLLRVDAAGAWSRPLAA